MRKTTFGALACVAVTGAAQTAHAADHRDAYEINLRPSANLADVFVFASPDTADNVVLGLTVSGLGSPDNNLSYAFDDTVVYQAAIDTEGDLEFDRTFDFKFEKPIGNDDGTYAQDYSVSLNGTPMMSATTTPVSVRSVDPVIASRAASRFSQAPRTIRFSGTWQGFTCKSSLVAMALPA